MEIHNLPSYFRLAKNVSKLSSHKRCHLGAVVVSSGKVLAVGTNRGKTDPHAPWCGLHAEMVAIKATGKTYIKNSSIFIYRETRKGQIAMARPCPHCLSALKEFGIRTIVYTISEFPFFEVEKI